MQSDKRLRLRPRLTSPCCVLRAGQWSSVCTSCTAGQLLCMRGILDADECTPLYNVGQTITFAMFLVLGAPGQRKCGMPHSSTRAQSAERSRGWSAHDGISPLTTPQRVQLASAQTQCGSRAMAWRSHGSRCAPSCSVPASSRPEPRSHAHCSVPAFSQPCTPPSGPGRAGIRVASCCARCFTAWSGSASSRSIAPQFIPGWRTMASTLVRAASGPLHFVFCFAASSSSFERTDCRRRALCPHPPLAAAARDRRWHCQHQRPRG